MADVTRGQNNQDQDWELQFLDGGSIDDDLAQFGEVCGAACNVMLSCRGSALLSTEVLFCFPKDSNGS